MKEIVLADYWRDKGGSWIFRILSFESYENYLPLLHLERDDDNLNVIILFVFSFVINLKH